MQEWFHGYRDALVKRQIIRERYVNRILRKIVVT
jgi:hypothetical protein